MRQQTLTILDGRYELGPVLGSGGMATVYRAHDRQLGRDVAVKVLADNLGADHGFVERFRREARSAAGLVHPNLVTVFDTGSDGDRHYIVMELVDGETLAARLLREGALGTDDAVRVAVGVCRALDTAHERGLVHRDVKPANVMIGTDGRVRLVDLGIARAAGLERLTTTGTVMGSSAYLSPEQAGGAPGDERSDVYALGCVLFEMLTGRPPFLAGTPVATLYLHVNEEPTLPSSVAPVPLALDAIVLRCLEKNPTLRYRSAADLERALLAASGGDGTLPLPAADPFAPTAPVHAGSARSRRRPPRGAAIMSSLAVLALAAGAVAVASRPAVAPVVAPPDAIGDRAIAQGSRTVRVAWDRLVTTIATQALKGELDEIAAGSLGAEAVAILSAFERGDPGAVRSAVAAFRSELGSVLDRGATSPEASARIERALLDLVDALRGEAVLVPAEPTPSAGLVVEPSPTSGEPEQGGQGPPPHARAKGHDDD